MTRWEYKCVALDRKGAKEDFSFTWTYSPWEMAFAQGGKKLLPAGLDELGRQGWELAGVLPSDLWSEGTRSANSSHGVRTISCTLVFKRPAAEKTQRSPAAASSATTPAPTAAAPTAATTPAPTAAPSATPPATEPQPSAPATAVPPAVTSAPTTPAADASPANGSPETPPDKDPPATDPSDSRA